MQQSACFWISACSTVLLGYACLHQQYIKADSSRPNACPRLCKAKHGLQIFGGLLEHARKLGVVSSSELSSASAKLEQAEATAADLEHDGKQALVEEMLSDDDEPISLALLQEEVVMYRRAISRLSEMCRLKTA